jgi:hypothetical protein
MAIAEIIELVGHSVEGIAGWRYLLSPTFRERTNERWRKQSRLATAGEVVLFGISFTFFTLLLGGILWLFLA